MYKPKIIHSYTYVSIITKIIVEYFSTICGYLTPLLFFPIVNNGFFIFESIIV